MIIYTQSSHHQTPDLDMLCFTTRVLSPSHAAQEFMMEQHINDEQKHTLESWQINRNSIKWQNVWLALGTALYQVRKKSVGESELLSILFIITITNFYSFHIYETMIFMVLLCLCDVLKKTTRIAIRSP